MQHGLVYVTSAGNESTPVGEHGSFHYQKMFNPAPVDDPGDFPWHNFAGDSGVDRTMKIVVDPGTTLELTLQWSDPFGASDNDYDLYLFGDDAMTNQLAYSTAPQNGSGDPYEHLTWPNSTNVQQTVQIAIQQFSGDARELELFGIGDDVCATEYSTPGDAIFGAGAVPGVITVGAVAAGTQSSTQAEDYSSQGPSTIYTNFATQQKITRNSLSGVAGRWRADARRAAWLSG